MYFKILIYKVKDLTKMNIFVSLCCYVKHLPRLSLQPNVVHFALAHATRVFMVVRVGSAMVKHRLLARRFLEVFLGDV